MSNLQEGRTIGEVVNFGPFVFNAKNGDEYQKFGILFKIVEEGHADEGRTVGFESLVNSAGAKKRIMLALKAIGYVLPPPGQNADPMLQHAKLVGRKARILVELREGKYAGVAFVDPLDDEGGGGGRRRDMTQDQKADFVESMSSFLRDEMGKEAPAEESSAPAPASQSRQAAPAAAAPKTAARAPAAAPARAAAAPAAGRPQRMPNPATQGGQGQSQQGGDEDIPF